MGEQAPELARSALVIFTDESSFGLWHSYSDARVLQLVDDTIVDSCIQGTDEIRSSSFMAWCVFSVASSSTKVVVDCMANQQFTLTSFATIPFSELVYVLKKCYVFAWQCHAPYCMEHTQFYGRGRGCGHGVTYSEPWSQTPITYLGQIWLLIRDMYKHCTTVTKLCMGCSDLSKENKTVAFNIRLTHTQNGAQTHKRQTPHNTYIIKKNHIAETIWKR